jgi:anti-sigma-K factor RskA
MLDRIEIEELMAAYAIDALDDAERAAAERLLIQDPSLWRLVSEHHEVLGVLAEHVEHSPSTPSPMVWQHIVGAIEGNGEATPVFPPAAAERRTRLFSRAAVALSAIALAVSGFVGYQLFTGQETDRLQAAVDDLLRDPSARIVTMASPEGTPVEARVVVGADGIGYIYADTLPALGDDRTYQLWAIVDGSAGQQIISAGIIGSDPDIAPFQVSGDLVGLAITNEVAGGVITSSEDPTTLWVADA